MDEELPVGRPLGSGDGDALGVDPGRLRHQRRTAARFFPKYAGELQQDTECIEQTIIGHREPLRAPLDIFAGNLLTLEAECRLAGKRVLKQEEQIPVAVRPVFTKRA